MVLAGESGSGCVGKGQAEPAGALDLDGRRVPILTPRDIFIHASLEFPGLVQDGL